MKTEEGLWKLSPSGLYGYSACPSCFWVDNHFKRGPSIPPVLNMAMDQILKNSYDKYRAKDAFPTEVAALVKEGVRPFTDAEQLDEWRTSKSALKVTDEKAGYVLTGK